MPSSTRAHRLAARRRRRRLVVGFAAVAIATGAVAMGVAAAVRSGDDVRAVEVGTDPPPLPSTRPGEPARSTTVGGSAGGVAVPEDGAYLGIWRGPGPGRPSDSRASLEAVEQQIGRRFAIDRRFYRWGTELPTDHERWTASAGRIPMVSLRSVRAGSGERVPWARIASGAEDQYLARVADSLREWGVPFFFILDAEPEAMVPESGSPEEFRAAWRRVVDLFRARGVANASFVFTTEAWSFRAEADRLQLMDDLYPGDAHVDWIASDPYNFYEDGRWASFVDEIEPWYAWARREHPAKPLAIAEWGSKEDPSDPARKAAWLHDALVALQTRFPEIKAVVYFDESKAERGVVNDWRIDTSAESLRAFAQIANHEHLRPGTP